MRPVALLALLLLSPVLAGCIGDEDTVPSVTPPRPLDTLIELDHDHDDASLHRFTWNVATVGYHTGFGPDEEATGGFTELAVHLPLVYLCRGAPNPGVVVIDVSEPAAPTFVSSFRMPRCDDIEVSTDGRWVFASAQRNQASELGEPSDGPANLPRGTWVLDASDPANLVLESFYPMPYNGPHTVEYHQYPDGREIVIHSLYDLYGTTYPASGVPVAIPLEGSNPLSQRIEIAAFGALPDGSMGLSLLSTYQDTEGALDQGTAEGSVRPHDATVSTNPLDGKTYLLVAYWDGGVHIVDLDDPENPALVSRFQDFAPSAYANVHLVRAFPELLDGKWVLVAEPELPSAEDEAGQITFLDASDPANPTKLGYWAIPGDVRILEPFLFSPHNFDLDADGRIYLAHQHGGVWVIDIGVLGTPAEPVTSAVHWTVAPDGELPGGPRTWGVFLRDGLLYASDSVTGLHIFEYRGP